MVLIGDGFSWGRAAVSVDSFGVLSASDWMEVDVEESCGRSGLAWPQAANIAI